MEYPIILNDIFEVLEKKMPKHGFEPSQPTERPKGSAPPPPPVPGKNIQEQILDCILDYLKKS